MTNEPTGNIKKGMEVELKIESLAFGGRGVARVNGFVVFIDDVLPGQRVLIRVTRKRKGYAEARLLQILEPSPEEVAAKCRHFGECGGCRFQHLDYRAQLKYKREQVLESLERIGGFVNPTVLDPIPSPDIFYYRNKMEYSFGRRRWLSREEIDADQIIKPRDFALGLHVRGRYDRILDLDECFLQSSASVEMLSLVKETARGSGIQPYSTEDHTGYWRHLVIREGKNTGETLINIVTADEPRNLRLVDDLARMLKQQFPQITTIVHNINRRKAEVAIGQEERVLHGPGTITERIGARRYRISANSFFQTNTKCAEILYQKVAEFADFKGDELVYDLYAGAGTISLYIADSVRQVVGFELVPDAVKDAEANCELNGIDNCSFVLCDLKDAGRLQHSQNGEEPDAIIIDPPRAGMHHDVVNQVIAINPQKIVYVSCNPTTFARDAQALSSAGYSLQDIQPVDMFPMTVHIELVSLFRKV
ncbi:23S rRNA (uracil(1939)-C(5))-methyltransferase RlmD [candidate division KSB1 bacterium]|nr:23S rRNA (uracil(1939)-C(5))-methyltransferase RlmD [candidate division KSB1 bacterium]